MSIRLQRGLMALELSPEHGGSVLSFRIGGQHLLRPSPQVIPENWSAKDFAAFPMTPFCGRIFHGKLDVEGRTIQLPANMPPEPHAIHGFGWQTGWQVDAQTASSATLSHTCAASAWPWAYEARQVFELTETGLNLTLQLTNRSVRSMPAGFGWHPYFPKAGAELTAPTIGAWAPATANTPDLPIDLPPDFDLQPGRKVEGMALDCAFDLSAPIHTIRWPNRVLNVEADPVFGKMVAYIPRDKEFFCVEAISHAPGATNSALPDTVTGTRQLGPGETLSGNIALNITETD